MGATAAVHPTDPVLRAYGLGKLDEISSESVSKHLQGCDFCQRRVAELSSDDFLVRLQKAHVTPVRAASDSSPFAASSTEGISHAVVPCATIDTLPPELVDHPDYEIVRELGRGGMGVVYLANNRLMGRPEVLKIVGRHLVERPGVLDRFLREIRSAAKLHHPNIVAAYSAMRLGQSLVLAMEYVEGLDLARLVKTRGPLPIAHASYFIHQAALGLQHALERGMVHRDIKPANLILARDGKKAVVKVLDFGLAKVTSEGQTDSGLTREGQMLGTPDYIAPEQIRDAQSADIRADIYSLGCTLYYLLSGGPPFRGDHLWDLYQAHFSTEAGPLNLMRPEVPIELAAVVAKMMAKDPGRRFQTPGEVARAMTPFFRPAPAQPIVANTEMSQLAPPVATAQPSDDRLVPTQPASAAAPPAYASRKSSKAAAPEAPWESLIEFKETEASSVPLKPQPKPLPAHAPMRRRPWVSWSWLVIAAASVAGLFVLGVVILIITKNGTAKITAPDDKPFTAQVDGVGVEYTPGGVAPLPATRNDHSIGKRDPSRSATSVGTITNSIGMRLAPTDRASDRIYTPRQAQKPVSIVASHFAKDDHEGWRTVNQDDTGKATERIKVETDGRNYWLTARDIVNGKCFGWLAPPKFTGDHSDKFGQFLRYRIRNNGNRSGLSDTVQYVRLRGRGRVIFVDQATVGRLGSDHWKTYNIKLDSSGRWKMLSDSGQAVVALDQDIKYVLSNIKDLWFRGEYGKGVDVGGLDEVEFVR